MGQKRKKEKKMYFLRNEIIVEIFVCLLFVFLIYQDTLDCLLKPYEIKNNNINMVNLIM